MILLHVSDVHFHQRWYRWLEESAPHHDVLVVSGNLLDLAHPSFPSQQACWVSEWISQYSKPICICSGLHDLEWDPISDTRRPPQWLRSLASPTILVDGDQIAVDGFPMLAVGAIEPVCSSAPIWVKHRPPSATAVAGLPSGRDQGEVASPVWSTMHRPDLVLCGHVHNPVAWQCVSRGVQFVNPGRNPGARFPNHVIIDLDERSLIHVADHPGGARCSSARLRTLDSSRAFESSEAFPTQSLQLQRYL